MPIYRMSSRDRRALRNRRIQAWLKWTAVVLSATLLAVTLLLVYKRHTALSATAVPASLEVGNPVLAH